jgi:hypothetical protein
MSKTMMVRGYTVMVPGHGSPAKETLYAVTEDGRIFESANLYVSGEFDTPGRAWRRVYELPKEAEFIGSYPLSERRIVKWA